MHRWGLDLRADWAFPRQEPRIALPTRLRVSNFAPFVVPADIYDLFHKSGRIVDFSFVAEINRPKDPGFPTGSLSGYSLFFLFILPLFIPLFPPPQDMAFLEYARTADALHAMKTLSGKADNVLSFACWRV